MASLTGFSAQQVVGFPGLGQFAVHNEQSGFARMHAQFLSDTVLLGYKI